MIGKSNRVYEILNRKRSLMLLMIWKLHHELGIPAEPLIKPPASTYLACMNQADHPHDRGLRQST